MGGILEEHYTYLAGSEAGTTTTLPETYDTTAKGSSTKLSGYRYAYDERNNIVQETDLNTGKYWKYAYDKLGQLQYATEYAANGTGQKRYKYYYDHAGNLTSWRIEDGTATNTQEEHTYTYGDSNWKDLLTAFDGKAITYDANGNPTKYYNGGTMTWRNGRQLASYSLGGKTYRYEYDVNGLRTRKSNADGGYTEYYIIDGLAVAERRYYSGGGVQYTLRYLYDESNNPVGFGMQYPNSTRWTNYYFEKNVQGDVIGVYQKEGDGNSATHILAARYSYDPYGNPTSMTNGAGTAVSQTSNTIAAINPFRYRGYRYDGDTGLYYLQSRYYDPVSCRFVNADKYANTADSLIGYNMFTYCANSPSNFIDASGSKKESFWSLKSDWAGRSILLHWLYGYGTDYIANEGRWGEYMRENAILGEFVDSIANEYGGNLVIGETILVDVTTDAVIENGEDIIGYQYLHGTNADAGGFQISGIIWRGSNRDICYNLKCTWNDIIDPNPTYSSDRAKANLAKFIPYANPTDYNFSVTWHTSNRSGKPGKGGKPCRSAVPVKM